MPFASGWSSACPSTPRIKVSRRRNRGASYLASFLALSGLDSKLGHRFWQRSIQVSRSVAVTIEVRSTQSKGGAKQVGRSIVVNWWALAIRGLAGILLGIAALVWTGLTIVVLIALFAAYLAIDGVFAIVAGARARSLLLVLEGVVGIIVAILAVLWPAITTLVAVYLVAAWAIVTGALELGAAYLLRRVVPNEWLLIVAGIISVVFGVLLA